ncbi:ubiquitin-like-specific protease 1D isoform X2 [Cryptomeria japonica]|uniref:ubiquitin-like-specific protease 1D isoform X2 n=1 Tax=Cryptomeria japonica TaxID=3369 RepID=UPI0025AC06E9|nr:ubiquitin-like-specific protease 1D isoform X2 [Cryptomeria japonica]
MEKHRENADNDDNAEASIDDLDDHALDEKIKRTKNLLGIQLFRTLTDCRRNLKVFYDRLLGERKRRKQRAQVQKVEPDTLSSVQELEIIASEDFSRIACNTRNSGYPDNSGLKLQHSSPSSHNNLPRNANHSLTTYSKRAYDYSSGDKDSSQRKDKISKCSTPAYVLNEENACRKSDEKLRKSLSLSKEGWTRKKVTKLIDLDEEDDKHSKQLHIDRMSERWMKDMKLYYPARDDPDSVEICYVDMECLDPFSYLSSPIMNFYIRPESLTLTQRNNYHFFNTYFYSKLDEALCERKKDDSLVKLRRWLKGVSIFDKAYVFLPIYYDLHWSLAIICFPAQEDKSGPFVLHLDSLDLHASNIIFWNIQSFLKIEWEHLNRTGLPNHIPIEDSTWITLIEKIENRKIQVPQQDNSYDCGLFVLYFIERFIKDAPPRIRREDLNMFGRKWFRPAEASRLRSYIKGLLKKHFEEMRNAR